MTLIVGCDPASTRLAFVARATGGITFASVKYTLGKRYAPECAGEAMDATLAFLDGISTMAPSGAARVAFVESPTGGSRLNIQALAKQAFVSGVVQACLVKCGYTVHLVPPTTWKSAVVGNGHASKDEIVRTVAGRWPKLSKVISNDTDLNDAAAICVFGEQVVRRGQVLAG